MESFAFLNPILNYCVLAKIQFKENKCSFLIFILLFEILLKSKLNNANNFFIIRYD